MLPAVPSDHQGLVRRVADHHPELQPLETAAAMGNWAGVEEFFAGLTDPSDRLHAGWLVGRVDGVERLLAPAAMAETGDTTLARTLYGIRLVVMGWNIRTAARAEHVSREQFAAFREHCIRAEQMLIDATAVQPDNTTAWIERIVTARALQVGQSEARRRYDRVAQHAPHVLPAQQQLLQKLLPKWSGSFEAAEAFVRERVAAAPPGSPVPALLLDYHVERWLDLDDNEVAPYLARIHDDLRTAEAMTLDPAWRPGFDRYKVHHNLAFLFSLAGLDFQAAKQFRAIGRNFTESPWNYLNGEAVDNFTKRRATALAKG
ncbi:hypothetical protein Val02_61300 [Virgisporangium aliadipatigenens]|uniref:Uncharacterized protein n=1 Tax=Virgisporangium aliadipatigenens TaxID=741659 RepID=A0A8J3YPD0_9ACTN|nr:hypothetical protein Val02_61300 [Virgisporangium aliadipatigenens]